MKKVMIRKWKMRMTGVRCFGTTTWWQGIRVGVSPAQKSPQFPKQNIGFHHLGKSWQNNWVTSATGESFPVVCYKSQAGWGIVDENKCHSLRGKGRGVTITKVKGCCLCIAVGWRTDLDEPLSVKLNVTLWDLRLRTRLSGVGRHQHQKFRRHHHM